MRYRKNVAALRNGMHLCTLQVKRFHVADHSAIYSSRSFQCSSCGFDASSPDVFPSCEETPTITIDNDALSSGPSDEGTTIFPTAPLASPHVLGDGAGDAAANAIAAAPQMPVLQHRPPEPGLAIPHTGEVLAHAGGGGGGPLLVDRAILVVLLAILALIVRKF